MHVAEEGTTLGSVVAVLDDLFGGRARVHLLDPATSRLIPLGTEDAPVEAPGPLHRALSLEDALVIHVGSDVPSEWSSGYHAWIPRGGCHVVAARIEGGGDVVGTLSVLRSERSRVPVVEDKALISALAARLGRSAAVQLARAAEHLAAGHEAPEGTFPPASPAGGDVRGEPMSDGRHDEGRAAEEPPSPSPPASTLEPVAEASQPAEAAVSEAPAGFDAVELTIRSVVTAIDLDAELLEVTVTNRGDRLTVQDRSILGSLLDRLAPTLKDLLPEEGLAVQISRRDGAWVASVRPRRLEDGWPARPEVPDEVAEHASGLGARVEVIADPEVGWLIELELPADQEVLERPAQEAAAASIDLMAASLGDTSHMVMLALDADGRVAFCNDEMAVRLGLTVADLIGRPLSSARGSGAAWDDFRALVDRVDDEGLVQASLAWPHPEESERRIRWTVSRTSGPSTGPLYLCFGVDQPVEAVPDP